MGDANVITGGESMNIDTLRKLALLSMPKRQGRNLTLSNTSLKSEGPTVFPSPAAKPPEDKEEGELSSDDDAEGATATFASVEPASNHDQAALKLHLASQGSTKEMLAPGANLIESNCNEGRLSTASVAEAFLASLRIPVPKSSRAPGDEKKEDDFVIKFDEDSDSDGDHQQSLGSLSNSTQLGNTAEKIISSSVSLPNTTPVSQSFPAVPNQKPSGLKSEIDRMKKQIAAMERSKGKPSVLPVLGKSTRVVSADTARPSVYTAIDTKSVLPAGTGNLKSVPDLESLRLQIAAKESELQQRRQRLAARGPEASSRVSSDPKGTGVGVTLTSLLPRTNNEGSFLAGSPVSSLGNVSAEKSLVPIRKEGSNQAEGLIALASVGPSGVCLPSNKKDLRVGGGDSVDQQNVNEDMSLLASSRVGTFPSNSVRRQLVSKGTKRTHAGVESLPKVKVARIDSGPPQPDKHVGGDAVKEPASSDVLAVNGTCKTLPVQTPSQIKRKVDDIEVSYESVMEIPGPCNSEGPEMLKKHKSATKAGSGDVSQVESFSNLETSGSLHTLQAPRSMSLTGLGQTQLHSEQVFTGFTSSSNQAVGSASVTDNTRRSDSKEGDYSIRGHKAVAVTGEALPNEIFSRANNAAHVQNSEEPVVMKRLAKISANEDGLVPKIHKARFQYEESHALPALAGVSGPDAVIAEPAAVTETPVRKRDVISSNQQVREGNNVKTGMYLRPSSVLLPPEAHLEHPAQQFLGLGHSYADNWDVDPDAETFEKLQAEEELLDKELEEAQEERHRCELRERAARKEYREAQRVLREVNAQCDLLNQKKEFLLSRIHLVEGRQYSRKQSASRKPWLISSVDNSSLRLTGLEVPPPCSPKNPATPVEHCPVSLPLHQPSREPGSCGADGGQILALQVAERGALPAVKQAGGTTVVQVLIGDSVSSEVDKDVGSMSRIAPSDGGLQDSVVHGHRGGVTGREVTDIGSADRGGISASAPYTESVDFPSDVGTVKAVAISSSALPNESRKTAVKILEAKAHDDHAPTGRHVTFSSGGTDDLGLDIRSERTRIGGNQVQARSDASFRFSGLSKQQGDESLAITSVSHRKLSTPVVATEYAHISKPGIDAVPGMQDKQAVPGSSAPTVETLVEVANIPRGASTVSGETEQRISCVVSDAVEGKTTASSATTITSEEEKSMPEKMNQVFADEETVKDASKFVQDGSFSEMILVDASTPKLLVSASSPYVDIRRELPFERVRKFQTPQGSKSDASEACEGYSSVDLGLKGLGKSIHDLVVTPSIKDKGFDALNVQSRDDGDTLREGEGQDIHSAVADGKGDASKIGTSIIVNRDGSVGQSPKRGRLGKQESDNSENLATEYQGFSSEGYLLNGVEKVDPKSGINMSAEVTEDRCQLELVFSKALAEGSKTGPASNGGKSQQILSETRRGSHAESEDISTFADLLGPRELDQNMSSNNSTGKEAVSPSNPSACGFGDMDTAPDKESEKLEMSSKANEVWCMESLKSIKGFEERSCLSQPESGPELQMRQKTSVGRIPSMERHILPAISSEVEVNNDLPDQGPAESCCPHGTDPQQEQHVFVPADSNNQLGSKRVEDAVVGDGVDRTYCPTISVHQDYQNQGVVLLGLENVDNFAFDQNRGGEDYSVHRATSDREIGKDREEWSSTDTLELNESDTGKEMENNTGVQVEVFRKALLDGNVFKRPSVEEEAVVRMGVQTSRRDTDKGQILPELQHHLLNQLLDMVETGNQRMLVHEGQSLKVPQTAVIADNGLVEAAQSAQVESSEVAAMRTEPLQVPFGDKAEVVSNIRNIGFCDDSSGSEPWVPSAVGFVSLRCLRGIVTSPSDTPRMEGSSNIEDREYVPDVGCLVVHPRYESPLTIFRAYKSLPQFAGAMQLSSSSNTWSHAINPHKPLCRFEHRGQCRNEHCPWQHADDYTITTQISPEIKFRETRKGVISDEKMDDSSDSRPKVGSFVGNSRVPQNSASPDTVQTSGSLFSSNGFSLQGSPSRQLHDYEISVPTYRIGYHTLKAGDLTSVRLGIPGVQRKVKSEIYHSFLLSPSIHRNLPSDSLCLLDSPKSRLSSIEASNTSQVPHWRYTGELREDRVFNENGTLHASKDVEMWLELALNHIDFDIASDKSKARDEALCILSRGLETKQNSVTLWMAYSCLFHTRRDNPECDDMFQFAIQYNPGSYELWLLYINSRPDLPSRLEAYERAVVALVEKGTQVEILGEDRSACLLDLALQMLYCMCVSGCMQDALSWVDDLIHDASTAEEENHRGSTSALLSHLTPHDACILWISCAYLSACAEMPLVVTRQLGCKQDLPYTLDWDTRASPEKEASLRVMRTLSTAASSARGCLSLEDPHLPRSDRNSNSKEVLGLNYVQCLAFYEGLESAGRASQHLISLYPASVELILLHARIEERRAGTDAGLRVFEEAVLQWPLDQPGFLRLWNQYAVHGLIWAGNPLAHKVLSKSIASVVKHPGYQGGDPLSTPRISKANVPTLCAGASSTVTSLGNELSGMWEEVKEHYLTVTAAPLKSDESTSVQTWHPEDMVYALINLALIEALRGDRIASQTTINKAMKISVSDRDSRQCWKELAGLQFSGADVKEQKMLRLLDRCKTESYILSQLKPLSLKVLDDLKRPQVRKFFVDLLCLLPVDHSLLNSILEICYGPSLLPSESLSQKDVFHFAEGILEAMPGNVEVALSLSKLVFEENGFSSSKSMSSAVWASALLVSSLQQCCPPAPEVYWVEAGLLLRQLRKEKSLEEYYLHALVKYPFSAALRHGLEDARHQIQESDGTRGPQQMDIVREVVGLSEENVIPTAFQGMF